MTESSPQMPKPEESKPFKLDFPLLTKAHIQKIARIVGPAMDLYTTTGKTPIPLDDPVDYYVATYSVYKETPILNFLKYSPIERKVLKGTKAVYSLNLLTLRPTANSKLKYDLPKRAQEQVRKIIETAK